MALTIFRDGHHKPAHKHNDMAHKCGLPYTIPRSHTIHHPSDASRRSVDHLPLTQSAFVQEPLGLSESCPQSQQTSQSASQQGSPNSAPAAAVDDHTPAASLDQSYLNDFAPTAAIDKPAEDGPNPTSAPSNMDEYALEQIVTSVPPPLDVSFTSFPNTSSNSPITCMAFQDPYSENYFASPDSEVPLGSTGMGAPSVDWSSFPIYSDVPASTSTQTPSYASFDYNSYPSGLPPPSSSGDISEVDEFGPLPGLGPAGGNDVHDLHSVSEASDTVHFRVSSASSLVGLPQAQLLSSNDLGSLSIDDFLKSANESTAALEHQLQAGMGIDQKPVPAQDLYSMSQPQESAPIWSSGLPDVGSTPPWDESYFRPSWA